MRARRPDLQGPLTLSPARVAEILALSLGSLASGGLSSGSIRLARGRVVCMVQLYGPS